MLALSLHLGLRFASQFLSETPDKSLFLAYFANLFEKVLG